MLESIKVLFYTRISSWLLYIYIIFLRNSFFLKKTLGRSQAQNSGPSSSSGNARYVVTKSITNRNFERKKNIYKTKRRNPKINTLCGSRYMCYYYIDRDGIWAIVLFDWFLYYRLSLHILSVVKKNKMAERFAKVNEQEIRELLDNTTPKIPYLSI